MCFLSQAESAPFFMYSQHPMTGYVDGMFLYNPIVEYVISSITSNPTVNGHFEHTRYHIAGYLCTMQLSRMSLI